MTGVEAFVNFFGSIIGSALLRSSPLELLSLPKTLQVSPHPPHQPNHYRTLPAIIICTTISSSWHMILRALALLDTTLSFRKVIFPSHWSFSTAVLNATLFPHIWSIDCLSHLSSVLPNFTVVKDRTDYVGIPM